jgi:endonuclease III-like uncharacterized protein
MAFKVIAGAILVQNTAWVNLEPAMVNLRQLGLLTNNCSGHPLNILLREGL